MFCCVMNRTEEKRSLSRSTTTIATRTILKAKDLAERFIKNFVKFTGNDEGKSLVAAGPKL